MDGSRSKVKDANAREMSHPSAVESHRSSLGSNEASLWLKPLGILFRTTTSGVFVDGARMTSRRFPEIPPDVTRKVLELPSPLAPGYAAIADSQECRNYRE